MAIPVLLILAVLWAAVLLPPLFRNRIDRRHSDSIGAFNYRLDVIGKTGGHAPKHNPEAPDPAGLSFTDRIGWDPAARPLPTTATRRRRRGVLLTLCTAVALTGLAAATLGGAFIWAVQLLVDAALIAYIVLLARYTNVSTERVEKVRYLPSPASPQLAVRRSISS